MPCDIKFCESTPSKPVDFPEEKSCCQLQMEQAEQLTEDLIAAINTLQTTMVTKFDDIHGILTTIDTTTKAIKDAVVTPPITPSPTV